MSDFFYRAFEERYYASQETIKDLRKQYLAFVEPLVGLYPNAEVFDAGCGRGEWLELMKDLGFDPHGCDLDDGMLAACHEKGLRAKNEDAVTTLCSLASESQAVVSAFHVVEHISFDNLRRFVEEAHRVLKPGGVLIMETPNSENLFVASRNFYLDPTHVRPIPFELLSFVTHYSGFGRVKTIRLQEDPHLLERSDVSIRDIIFGVSPDYAVICQKSGSSTSEAVLDHAFQKEYGLSMDSLTERFESRLIRIESMALEALKRSESLPQLDKLKAEIQVLKSSRSWRVTAPMRWFGKQLQLLKSRGIRSRVKAVVVKILNKLGPKYLSFARATKKRLIASFRASGLYAVFFRTKIQPDTLTPRTIELYDQLKSAAKEHKKGIH